jgi:transcriptional regulator with XRE-family HTH domain
MIDTGNNQPEPGLQLAVDSSVTALRERISSVIDEAGSRIKAADASGVSADMLAKYVSGASRPRFEAIARLCVETGVSLDWVATGEGPRYRQEIDEKGEPAARFVVKEEQTPFEVGVADIATQVVDAFLWLRGISAAQRLELPPKAQADLLRIAVSLPREPENEAILARIMQQLPR